MFPQRHAASEETGTETFGCKLAHITTNIRPTPHTWRISPEPVKGENEMLPASFRRQRKTLHTVSEAVTFTGPNQQHDTLSTCR